ncbi:FecCD family ABC transporter permease [Pseudoteredinibacter isoporae]|uniref:FecCD family ABC transporter permease n=1 Tax=Pseudoteredinibacter isoporae TaxID=570281 RepID=UPI00310205B0
MSAKSPHRLIAILASSLLPAVLLALCLGTELSSLNDAFVALLGQAENIEQQIIRDIRLPRVILALLVGACLAVCGTASQGLFRNPLADPSLIGVSAGAAMGASLCIVFFYVLFAEVASVAVIAVAAFLGGMLASVLVYRLANNENGTSVAMMLLAGIAVTAFAAAVSSFSEFASSNAQLRRISLWQMGSLAGSSAEQRMGLALVLVLLLVVLQRQAMKLNALLLGESEARHLGVNVQRLKIHVIIAIAAGVGLAVATSGTIGFVGLLVPHIMRLIIGPDHRYLLLASALGGALLLLMADTLARTLFAPSELPVGVITAIMGAPFFLALLRIKRNQLL